VTAPASVDFWFDFASTYSYVAALRLPPLAAARGVQVRWQPFLLGPLFTAQQGIKDSPFNVNPVRGRYMWRDLERLCRKYQLPWRQPSQFPRNSLLAARVALLSARTPEEPQLVRRLFEAGFAEDLDIASPEVVGRELQTAGLPPGKLLAQAALPETKDQLRAQTVRAEALGLFGAPSFVVRGELFFGQDRLEDALDWAQASAN
jgi:2-hydroxychromene-2-carboxylate isomerase